MSQSTKAAQDVLVDPYILLGGSAHKQIEVLHIARHDKT